MKRMMSALIVIASLAGAAPALAQDAAVGPGRVEISLIPGGFAYFTEQKDAREPSFGNYDLGAALGVNFTRYVGVEGEVSGALGVSQSLPFGGVTADRTSPHLLNYTGNLVVSAANRSSVVPYVTGGLGGLTLFETTDLGIDDAQTFLTGNVGGGVKWYAPNNRWGLRGDYRFGATQSKDSAPEFFGRETRYVHRIYAAVIINTAR